MILYCFGDRELSGLADFIIYLLPKNKITWVIRNNSWSHVFSNILPVFEKIINKYSKNLTIYTNTQVKTFFNAQKIIGLHGAGFANLIFCKPNTEILEILLSNSLSLIINKECF